MEIYDSNRKDKRFMAVFKNNNKRVHFGLKDGNTFIDHNDNDKRKNYIKRHRGLNENWNDVYSAGTLSRYILWEKRNLRDAIRDYKRRFNLM